MKIILWLIGLVALVLELTYAEPDPAAAAEVRKTRHPSPSSAPTGYNSISAPDSETLSKLQNQVAPPGQISLKPIIKTSDVSPSYIGTSSQPLSAHVSNTGNQNIAGQYYMAVTPHGAGNQMLAPATTPLIMQYINPQGQPTGGLQYIQLLRPILYPYNAQYAQPSYVQQQQPSAINQHQQMHHPHTLSHYSTLPSPTSPPNSPPSTQSSFVPFQPSSLAQYGTAATTASHHLQSPLAYSQPVGQYSSPVVSYYPSRISLLNSPGDMSLNTNEYMPPPGDHVFIKGVKSIRA
ncbi:uncharacterized protein LOC131432314 [Malaya genurostris]|uniref:uncharacterized protein LOC131432314 n=1 Tax=Malaya genurostris TaxID=325434 RepID=UPI0026F381EA|nr:uncharacterized protein LOC131432314 [Malaya genurostris]